MDIDVVSENFKLNNDLLQSEKLNIRPYLFVNISSIFATALIHTGNMVTLIYSKLV